MSTNIKKLIEDRGKVAAEIKELADKAKEADGWNPELEARWNEVNEKYDTMTTDIERQERAQKITTEMKTPKKNMIGREDYNSRYGGAIHTQSKTSEWRDSFGRPVNVLSREERMTDLLADARDEDAPDLGRAITAIVTGNWREQEIRALAGGATPGSYLLNPVLSSQWFDLARARATVIEAGAKTVSMPTSEMSLVKVMTDPTVGWYSENDEIASSDPTVARLTLQTKSMACLVKMSRELFDDAPMASETVKATMAAKMAHELDRVCLVGSAVTGDADEPTGICNTAGINVMPVNGAPSYDSFLDAIKDVEEDNGNPKSAIYSPGIKNYLAKLKTSTDEAYLTPPVDFMALQRLVTTQLSDVQAVVGDFSQMIIGIRHGVIIQLSQEAGDAFAKNQVWIRAIWRGDVGIVRANHFSVLSGISF